MADPASIVLTHVKVVIVAQFEACMAKFAIAAIERLLRLLEVPFKVHWGLKFVKLEDFRGQYLTNNLNQQLFAAFCIFLLLTYIEAFIEKWGRALIILF